MAAKKFVEIDDCVLDRLEKIAAEKGFDSVEKMLTQFADDFSGGCSVTSSGALPAKDGVERAA